MDVLRLIVAAGATGAILGAGIGAVPFSRTASLRSFRAWARVVRGIFGVELEIEDRNRGAYSSPPYVFVNLNQTSLIESVVTPAVIPVRYRVFANIEYLLLPFVGWSVWSFGAIVVVRQWKAQRRRSLDRAIAAVRDGHSMYISIEGQRSDGPLLPFKKGPVRLAIAGGATIVPIVFRGARERLPRGAWRVRPGRVQAILLEGIPTAGLGEGDVDALVARLRALAEANLEEG